MLKRLTQAQIQEELSRLSGWKGDERGLEKTLSFGSFRAALDFMQACFDGIEKLDHHPVWTNKYNRVEVHLDTFDVGHFVTGRDIALAHHLESVLTERGAELGYTGAGE